jgi:protein TonB
MERIMKSLAVILVSAMLACNALAAPKVTKKVPPDFPGEAVRASINNGVVHARMYIRPDGYVENVEILSAEPRRVFDKEVIRALREWKFEPTTQAQMFETRLIFRADE